MKLQDGKKEKEKRREEKKSAAIFSAAKNQRADEKSKTHAQQKGNAREKFNFTNHSRVITWKMNFFFPPRRKLQMETRNGKVPELRGKQITGNLYVLIFVCISKKISILLCLLIKRKSCQKSKGFLVKNHKRSMNCVLYFDFKGTFQPKIVRILFETQLNDVQIWNVISR